MTDRPIEEDATKRNGEVAPDAQKKPSRRTFLNRAAGLFAMPWLPSVKSAMPHRKEIQAARQCIVEQRECAQGIFNIIWKTIEGTSSIEQGMQQCAPLLEKLSPLTHRAFSLKEKYGLHEEQDCLFHIGFWQHPKKPEEALASCSDYHERKLAPHEIIAETFHNTRAAIKHYGAEFLQYNKENDCPDKANESCPETRKVPTKTYIPRRSWLCDDSENVFATMKRGGPERESIMERAMRGKTQPQHKLRG